jgi:hypothetical protein
MEVAILSDTHVPSRAGDLPDWVRSHVRDADHVIHAGDFDGESARETVADLADDLTAVAGNMDRMDDLPPVETVELDGVTFVVTHGTGPSASYEERIARTVQNRAGTGPTVGVAGHTHERLDERIEGVRILNPGSATGAPPADEASMLTAEVEDGDIDVTVHTE